VWYAVYGSFVGYIWGAFRGLVSGRVAVANKAEAQSLLLSSGRKTALGSAYFALLYLANECAFLSDVSLDDGD